MGAERIEYMLKLLAQLVSEIRRDPYFLTRDDQDTLERKTFQLSSDIAAVYRERGVNRV